MKSKSFNKWQLIGFATAVAGILMWFLPMPEFKISDTTTLMVFTPLTAIILVAVGAYLIYNNRKKR